VLEWFSSSDAMLMGREPYEFFAAIWPSMTGEFADRVNSIRKYVFYSTLQKADWDNTTIIRGDVTAEATRFKQQDGGDIAFGYGRLAQALLSS
jgi:dihydrofolate reductase